MEEGERRWYEERIEVTRLERRLNFTKTCTSVRVEDGVSRPLERRACVGTIYPEIVGRNGVQGRANFRQFTRLTFVQIKFPMYIYKKFNTIYSLAVFDVAGLPSRPESRLIPASEQYIPAPLLFYPCFFSFLSHAPFPCRFLGVLSH